MVCSLKDVLVKVKIWQWLKQQRESRTGLSPTPVPCSLISDHDAVLATVTVNVRGSKYLPRYKFIRNMEKYDKASYQHEFLCFR